jgi:hypothetical protein
MEDQTAGSTSRWNEFVVAFVDILGQKENLKTLAALHGNPGEAPAFERASSQLLSILTLVQRWFRGLVRARGPLQQVAPGQEARGARLDRLLARDLRLAYAGDSFIAYGPAVNDEGIIENVSRLLGFLPCIVITCQAEGVPLRGAIELGVGTEDMHRGIYGPVVAEAYRLESEVAQYPRIMIGDRLLKRISTLAQHPLPQAGASLDNPDQINALVAESCLSLVTRDQDGMTILDYLGTSMSRGTTPPSEVIDDVMRGYRFVVATLEKFRAERNTKLAFRYALLRDYYVSRLANWGLKP